MGALALLRSYRLLLVPTFAGLAFSLYLATSKLTFSESGVSTA